MNIIKSFNNFILEKKENNRKFEYGCLMINYEFPDIEKLHELIHKDDIAKDGLENDPHTTILFGLHDKEIDDDDIFDIISKNEINNLILYNASLFESDEFDVLKFDVKEQMLDEDGKDIYKKSKDFLYKMNKTLTDNFPYTTDFPDYHPHCTIGYLKKGEGKKYIKELKDN